MQSSSPEQQNGQDSRSARRRLLKGSFAVPAALTLASGSALAAGSTGLRCVMNSAETSEMPSPGPTDTLVRVKSYTTLGGPNAYTFIKGSDVAAKLGTSTGTLQVVALNGSLSATNILCVVSQTKTPPDRVRNNVYGTPTSSAAETGVFYAVLVDANGNIIGISTVSSAVGSAVSNNCWASFAGLVP